MPTTPEAAARTRAFARVIGPYVAIIGAVLVVRAPALVTSAFLETVFGNSAVVWMLGASLLLGGLVIIAHHQYWSGAPAIVVSLFGWFVALRGLVMLAAPQVIHRGALAAAPNTVAVRSGFGALALIGCWLTVVGYRPARH